MSFISYCVAKVGLFLKSARVTGEKYYGKYYFFQFLPLFLFFKTLIPAGFGGVIPLK